MMKSRHILVLTYWSFNDALIQTYTLPYLRIISELLPQESKISLVTLERNTVNGRVISVEPGLDNLQLELHFFGLKAIWRWAMNLFLLRRFISKNNVDTIHCWCTPAGTIGVLLSRLSGKSLIIDSYEPHADAMVENGSWKRNSIAYRLLHHFECMQTKYASYLIAAAPYMRTYAHEQLGWKGDKMFVKPACVDLQLFTPSKRKNKILMRKLDLENKTIIVYAGKFGGIYLDEEVFILLKEAQLLWKEHFKVLLLTSHSEEEIVKKAAKVGLSKEYIIIRFVPHAEIADYIALADFAITPVKPVPSKRACSPIKNGEYWASGLPVLITPNISQDSELIANHKAGVIWNQFDAEGSKLALLAMKDLLHEDLETRTLRIRSLARSQRSFDQAKEIYRQIYSYI